MAPPFEETVRILLESKTFSRQLKELEDSFVKFRTELTKYKFNLDLTDPEHIQLAIGLYKDLIAGQKKDTKELNEFQRDADAQRAADQKKWDAEELSRRKSNYKALEAEAEAMDKAAADRARHNDEYAHKLSVAQFKEDKARDEARAAEEYQITKALYQYRKDWAAEERNIDIALHRYRMDAIKEEAEAAKAAAKQVKTASGIQTNLPQLARVGAGLSVATGNYNVGGGMYAAANMLDSMGLSAKAISITTAEVVGLGVALSAVGVVVGSLIHGKEFNEELAKMSTLLADSTASAEVFRDALNDTAKAAVNISNKFNIGLVDVVKAFKDALSSGIEARDLERFMDVAATLSTSLGTSLSESTNILTTFKDTYQLTITELGKINDYLFNAVDVGKVTVNDLVNNLGRLVPIAHQAGLAVQEIFVGVSVLTREGLSTSQAVTSLSQFITGMVSPSAKAAKEFTKLGIAFGDAAFEGKTLGEVFKELKDKTGGSSSLLGELFPEIRAKRAAAGGIQSLGSLLDEVSTGIAKVGTDAVASARAMDTLWTNLGKTTTEFSNLFALLGSNAANGLNKWFFSGTVEKENSESQASKRVRDRLDKGISKEDITKEMRAELYGNNKGIGFNPYAAAESESSLKKIIEAGVKLWEDGGRDSAKAYSNGFDAGISKLEKSISDTVSKATETLSETKDSHVTKKVLGHVLSSDEKDQIDTLELEISDLKELLDLKRKNITIEAEKQGQSYRDQISNSKGILDKANADPNSSQDFIKFAQQELAKFEERYKTFVEQVNQDLKNISGGEEISSAIDAKILQLNEIKRKALEDPYRNGGTDYSLEAAQYNAEIAKKEADEKKKLQDDFFKYYRQEVKDIAEEDIRDAKRVASEKKKIQSSLDSDMRKENNRDKKIRDDVYDKTFQAKVSGPDIDRNRRAATEEKNLIKEQMEAAIAGGATQSVFEELAKRFERAIDAIAANTEDKARGLKILQGNEGELGGLNSEYHNKYVAGYAANTETNNRIHKYVSKSADQIRNEAVKKADNDVQVEKVVLDARIKLNIDGTVSTETLDAIAGKILDKIHSSLGSKTTDSRYDRPKRTGNNFTADDSESNSNDDNGDTE